MIFECPGSQKFKHPYPETIKCDSCGKELEIWSDEVKVKCHECEKTVIRKSGQSCLDWCPRAKECIGEERFKALGKKSKKNEKSNL